VGVLLTLLLDTLAWHRLTLPLHRLAARLRDHSPHHRPSAPPSLDPSVDEVQVITKASAGMTPRIEQQAADELQQASAHGEMMASVADDLRTPLTALHGHLTPLAVGTSPLHERLLAAASS
jgi:signal transduction histidine kinase